MKTAISMPDETFERVSRTAAQLGMSRSELLTRAAVRYMDRLDEQSVTDQINATLSAAGEDEDTAAFVAASRRRFADGADDEW